MSVKTDEAVPSGGTVTGLGRFTETSDGATPDQEALRLTVELNPFTDETVTVVDLETPGVNVIIAGVGWEMKSGLAEEIIVPEGATFKSSVAECDIPPLVAVTVNG